MKLYIFGDSIAFGQHVSPHKTWVHLLSQALERDGYDITVQNPSINGNTTRMALERMPQEVQAHQPDLLVIQFGLNDCNCWQSDRGVNRVSLEGFEANLIEMIQRACHNGCRKVFLNTNHSTTKVYDSLVKSTWTYQQSNRIYNNVIRNVHEKYPSTTLIDIERLFPRMVLKAYLLPDGIHLSALGHQTYFEIVYPKIQEEVARLNYEKNSFCRAEAVC
jgi:acyl-CoA thioesterase-1